MGASTRGRGWLTVATTARRGFDSVASVLRVLGMAIVAVLVIHILLTLLQANPDNGFAVLIRDLVDIVDLGLSDLFQPANPQLAVVLNYGVAAAIWFAITSLVVRVVSRLG